MSETDIDAWFQANGPGYEHLDEQGIVDLSSAESGDLDDNDEDSTDHQLAPKTSGTPQCPISNPNAPFSTRGYAYEPTLVQLRELAAEKRESSRKQTTIDSSFS